MLEMHLRQPAFFDKSRFTHNAYGPFTKNKERIQKFKEIQNLRHIYRNKIDNVYFHHDMAYGDFSTKNSF